MSNVRGRIAVDVQFADSTTSSDEQSLKTITLQDATEYTTGKVAIVSGTVGTSQVSLAPLVANYMDAAGVAVSFSAVTRVAMRTSGNPVRYLWNPSPETIALVASGQVAVGEIPGAGQLTSHRIRTTSGTASYTLVLYGT